MKLINKILSFFKKKQNEISSFDNKYGFMIKHGIVKESEYDKVKNYYETK